MKNTIFHKYLFGSYSVSDGFLSMRNMRVTKDKILGSMEFTVSGRKMGLAKKH
jgi:hypothetical protein